MFEHALAVARSVDAEPGLGLNQALRELRQLGLEDFGELMASMPNPELPNLSRVLPAMASDDVQDQWTGTHGFPLLRQTGAFVRSVAYNYIRLTGRPLDGADILDFGCGYGRIARFMLYFTDPERLVGLDPLPRSIELCHQAGFGENFRLSQFLPVDLPVGEVRFDLIYAFSVFTHTSRRATRAALDTLRFYLKPGGIAVITIRPVEYWAHYPEGGAEFDAMHRDTGFAFVPHGVAPIDGDITYGDTSMTLPWLEAQFPHWQVTKMDRSLEDPLQIYVFLRPR